MKLIRPFVNGLVASGIALGMLMSLSIQAAEPGVAKVVNIKGSARYMTTDNRVWRPLKVGAFLKPGAIVQTAVASYVDVVLNNPKATSAASMDLSAADASVSSATTVATKQPPPEQHAV